MRTELMLELTQDTCEELDYLADSLGYSREMAVVYAVRLVSACVREGLLRDVPARAWPREAQLLTGTGGKVIEFYARREKNAKESD